MNEFTLQRIAAMEAAFDRTAAAVQALETNAWREDFEADEAGLVPKDLKRGVLSEDGLYNLLGDIVSLHERMKEFCE